MMEVTTWVVGVRVGAVVVWVVAGVLEGGSGVEEGDEGGGEEAGGGDEGSVTGVEEGGLGVGEVTGEEGSAGEEGDEGRWDGVAVGVGGGPDEVSTEEIGGLALDGLEDGSVEAADGEGGATEETTRGDVLAVPLLAIATAERKEKWTATTTIGLLLEEYTVARNRCVCSSASEKCDCTRLLVPGMRQARARRQPKEGRGRRW